jgi:hypothetical protein
MHVGATCNQPVEPVKDWRSDCLPKRNLVGVELCGVLGRLHSIEGLAQSNNNAKLNYSAKPITNAADHKCGEERKRKNGRKSGKGGKRHAASLKRCVEGVAEPIVPLSLSFFLFSFAFLALFLCFFPAIYAGGTNRGNTKRTQHKEERRPWSRNAAPRWNSNLVRR